MPTFEDINVSDISQSLLGAICDPSTLQTHSRNEVDFSGLRVSNYLALVRVSKSLTSQYHFLTSYNASTGMYKYWEHLPPMYKTETRNDIVRALNSIKGPFLSCASSFQLKTTESWNPESKHNTKLIIPPVSLRDEIKVDEFGIAVIELLCLVGILLESTNNSTNNPTWNLML